MKPYKRLDLKSNKERCGLTMEMVIPNKMAEASRWIDSKSKMLSNGPKKFPMSNNKVPRAFQSLKISRQIAIKWLYVVE